MRTAVPLALGAILLLALPTPPPARAIPGAALADSAAAARAAWRDARRALAEGDTTGAAALAGRAHAAWPAQWYYAYAQASLAASAGDAPGAAAALRDLAALGAGPDVDRDDALTTLAASSAGRAAGVPEALDAVRANRAPIAASAVAFAFPAADSAFHAEGIAAAPATGRFFVTSVRERKVAVVEPGAAPRTFADAGADSLLAVFAAAADERRALLWVASAGLPRMEGFAPGDSGRGIVSALDLAGGGLILRVALPPAPEGHVPGDVQVASDGSVYVSDSAHPAIYRIRRAKVEEFATDPAFRSLQGQALSRDGRTLFVADYSHGIAAVDLATRAVSWLDPPATGTVLGIDGMARDGDDLVAVQNGMVPPRIVRIRIARGAPGGASGAGPSGGETGPPAGFRVTAVDVLDRNVPVASEPTSGVVVGGAFYYVANGAWEEFDDSGARVAGTTLRPPVILRLPLRPRR